MRASGAYMPFHQNTIGMRASLAYMPLLQCYDAAFEWFEIPWKMACLPHWHTRLQF